MDPVVKNLLITGPPGIGKTTVIRQVADKLRDLNPVGFFTAEIREGRIRKGFELVSLDGRRGVLSHVAIQSRHRVGRYKVDLATFEGFLSSIPFEEPSRKLAVIDEIGKMECLSAHFRMVVVELLDSKKYFVATIALRGGGIIEEVKRRKDVKLFEMNVANRDSLAREIVEEIRKTDRGKSRRVASEE